MTFRSASTALSLLMIALLVVGSPSTSSAAHVEVRSFPVASVGDWVVHEKTGRVFASLSEGNEVVEFTAEGEERQRFKVGESPGEMLIKGDRLLVGCTKSPSIHLVDLTKNEVSGSIAVNGKGPYALFCSQSSDPYLYCICNTGSAWWDGEVFQIDLNSKSIRKQTKVQGWGQSHPTHVAMSRDGKWILPDARGASSPSGADLMRVDAEELIFTQIRDYHSSFGQKVAGPFNRYWTFGSDLYTLDITKNVRKFSGDVFAIHPRHDLAASLSDLKLHLERFSDVTKITVIDLPASRHQSSPKRSGTSRKRGQPSFDPTIQFDLKRNRVFVGLQRTGHWVDLAEYEKKLSPIRIIQAPSEATVELGKPVSIPISMTNPSLPPKPELSLAQGPKSITFEAGKLSWIPTSEQVGNHEVELVLKSADSGRELDRTNVSLKVVLPGIPLGFQARSMKLTPSGKRLAVWGVAPGQESRHPAHPGPDSIAIIDVEQRRVLTKKTISQGIIDVEINEQHVFIAPRSGNLFYRLSHDLDTSDRHFLKSTPRQLLLLSPKRLAVIGDQAEVFDADTMKVSTPPSSDSSNFSSNRQIQAVGQDLVRFHGSLLSRETGELLRIEQSTGLPTLTAAKQNHSGASSQQSSRRWGRQLFGSVLSNHRGSRIANWSNVHSSVLAEDIPMAIVLRTVTEQSSIRTILDYCDLIDGTVFQETVLEVHDRRSRPFNPRGQGNQILVKGNSVLVLNNNSILVSPFPRTIARSVITPPHFREKQTTEIEFGGPKQFKLEATGGQGALTFSLLAEYPGVQLDAKTGIVEVETQQIWTDFIASFFSSTSSRSRENLERELANNARIYRKITGKTLADGRLAALLPVSAAVRDQEGQEDTISFNVILPCPLKDLDEARRSRKQQQQEQIAYAQQMREAAVRTRDEARKSQQNPPDPSVKERLEKLETRMRRIEAALDSILKRLEEE